MISNILKSTNSIFNAHSEENERVYQDLKQRYSQNKDPWGLNPEKSKTSLKFVTPLYRDYFKTRVFGKENVKEKLLEKAKKSVLWKREKKDTAFYEMDMQSRQEVWMNRRAEKAERLEQRKIMEMKQQMPRIPDLTKTKDSWIRAKK